MKIIETSIPDLLIIEPTVYFDNRGFFYESYNETKFLNIIGNNIQFVQDNQSCSKKGVLRGLHYQLAPHEQGKLVRCVSGKIYDVAVDIRKNSATYGKWFSIELTPENKLQLWIPAGFAHGFLSLEDNSEILYKTTSFYNAESEASIIWNDPTLDIKWPILNPILSEKDRVAPFLQ
ncbi:dTDP-4-dehydrorhamnose 3,5-epimerase [Providencia stuartii]|uniref:dTDP-4-dehydrorhamnose 3,5-epimerase n=1 Tax=Providencia stuartii TaxID=588 RepID=UPI0034E57461